MNTDDQDNQPQPIIISPDQPSPQATTQATQSNPQPVVTGLPVQGNLAAGIGQVNTPNNQAVVGGIESTQPGMAPTPQKSKKSPIIILAIVLVIAGFGAAGFYIYDSKKETNTVSKSTANSSGEKQTTTQPATLAKEPYNDPETGGAQYYPDGWVKDDSATGVYGFKNPVPDKTSDGKDFGAWMNVDFRSASGVNEDEYVNSLKVQRAKLPNYTLISTKKLTTDSGTTFTLLEEKYGIDNIQVHDYKAVAVQNGTAVIITTQSLDESWSKYESVFMQSIVK